MAFIPHLQIALGATNYFEGSQLLTFYFRQEKHSLNSFSLLVPLMFPLLLIASLRAFKAARTVCLLVDRIDLESAELSLTFSCVNSCSIVYK